MNASDLLETLDSTRLLAASAIVAIYLVATIWFLRPVWRRNSLPSEAGNRSGTLVAFASQTGFAEQIATQTAQSLATAGTPIRLVSLAQIDAEQLPQIEQALFVVSTTGEGDAPDPVAKFVRDTLSRAIGLTQLRYGVLALGDREYDNFCAFGHRLDGWLRHQGATPLFDVVEVDNSDEGALRHWQHQLGVLAGTPDLPDWDTPTYHRWRLVERRLLNPGSAGPACFHVTLRPADPAVTWTAGDIAEVDPHNSTWNSATSTTLPHREYSIASLPADGGIELLVRQMRRPGGEPGLGSGWLTQAAALNSEIALRIRHNPNFHPPLDSRPLLLIGNGTGLAGLRAVLKARLAANQHRNWLLFGERNIASDYFYRDDIELWHRQGGIETLDLVFSRDQPERTYVQHRLRARAEQVREWLDAGAAIFVCGSLEGMAPAVDAALRDIVGAATLEQLLADGRYRRDVY